MAKVYVKTDSNDVIIEINSDIFLQSVDDYILIDEGEGDRYAHAQGNYLPDPLIDNSGKYNFKLVEGTVIALTSEEKEVLFPVENTRGPTTEERISVMEDAVQELILMQLGAGGGEGKWLNF